VDDKATGVLMKTFYENFINQGKAEALRTAQLSLMKNPQYVYPYYWAHSFYPAIGDSGTIFYRHP